MNTYITKADVDEILGADWAGTGDADRAVLQANAWMSAKGVMLNGPVDDDVKLAGAYLAQEAASGNLYADSEGSVKRERVKADTVEVETEFMDGSRPRSGNMTFILSLLGPFLPNTGGASTFSVRRA